jgi:DNA primase
MRFSQTFLDELFARASITAVVGRRVSWDKRKSNPARGDLWACCPFHGEKSPSFHVEEAKGRYYCFGCQEKGNALDFLMKMDRLSFPEAVEALAQEVGLALPAREARAPEQEQARKGAMEALEAAALHFERELRGPAGAAARAYLLKRGLPEEVWGRFRLGFAPDQREGLKRTLEQQSIAIPAQIEAGLLIPPDDGRSPYDRFRDRIMFPIEDARGRVIAFGGRAMAKDAQAKYLNSPETPVFSKGRTLYRLGPARALLAKDRAGATPLVVAEGYMDVIALERAGFPAVAPLGTAVTEDQIKLLWKLAPEPILCLDGDKAGQAAAGRVIDRALPLLEPGKSLRFVTLPGGKDPDDMLREAGPTALAQALAAAEPLIEALWRRLVTEVPYQTPEQRAGLKARLRAASAGIANPDVREAYSADLDARFDALFPRPVRGARRAGRGAGPVWGAPAPASAELKARAAPGPPRRILELVSAPLQAPALLADAEDVFAGLSLPDPALDALRDGLLQVWNPGTLHLEKADVRRHLERRGALEALALLEHAHMNAPNPYARPGPEAAALWRAGLQTWELDMDLERARADARSGDAQALARLTRLQAERRDQAAALRAAAEDTAL